MNINKLHILRKIALGIGLLLSSFCVPSQATAVVKQPNIVLILADDLGFSDLGSYGSEINTPNIDRLANHGVRFSNYHTSASCAPTRAMLLTGVDSHRAGVGNIAEALSEEQSGSPFYRGTLNDNVVTIASLLKDNGYHTYMAGKWHLGYQTPELRPINRGFEQTVMMPLSGADNWAARSYLPNYSHVDWFANGEKTTLPDDFYSSKFIVDKSIEFINHNINDDKPFFSYVAFQAVHIPVQAPKAFTDKYLNVYDQGWTDLRLNRQKAVKKLGLVPVDAKMLKMETTQDWQNLSAVKKRYHAKSMAVYAGMVDAMDHHIGRLVDHLIEIGEYDNTVFIFTSDNGGEASDPVAVTKLFSIWMKLVGYNTDYEDLGEKGSYNYIGPSFASAAVAPLGHYKFYSGEGGLRVPMIVAGTPVKEALKGSINDAFIYVKDLAPSILQLAGIAAPGTQYKGKKIEPITGKSIVDLLDGRATKIHDYDETIAYEIGGNAALFKGKYKIMVNRAPLGDGKWHLFDINKDPGETNDLSGSHPQLLEELQKSYQTYMQENGVLKVPEDYDQRQQIIKNAMHLRLVKPVADFWNELF